MSMSRFFQLKSYVNHWLDAVDEHSIHSPYFFDFYNNVIKMDDPDHQEFNDYEGLRSKLLVNTLEVNMVDLGARSTHFNNNTRTLAQIAATSLSPASYCRLYNRILHYIDATQIVELGTSMGITTLYLAQKDNVHVTTFEGNTSMVNVALTNFEYFEKKKH